MLMSKNFVESVLPNNLKQLLNNQNYDCGIVNTKLF